MPTKLAINGFGRIGRLVLRALIESGRKDLEVVAINDLGPVDANAHLLEFDSVHGRLSDTVRHGEGWIDAGRGPIATTAIRTPADLPWGDVDIVLECTGLFKGEKALLHLENGASRVLVSAPSSGADKTIVYGVNHKQLSAEDVHVSNASCTTNCLAPIAKVLNDGVGLKRGFATTVHAYTGDQPTLDTLHSDLYRARAAALSMIPTTTGAARAVGLVLPELAGKLDGTAIRVPTPNVSLVDLTFEAARDTSSDEINTLMRNAAEGPLKGILNIEERPLVSTDYNHDAHSSILASDQTRVLEGRLGRVLGWYDNEWGYANRMLDTASEMARYL